MNKSSKLLLRAIAGVCFLGFSAVYAQRSDISIKVNPVKKEIVTYVTLSEIPPGVDIIWRQRIPQEAHFASYSRNPNADSKIIMMSFSRHLLTSKMSFSFVCTMDTIGDWIAWGESSITYTGKDSKEKTVKFLSNIFIISQCLMDSAEWRTPQETANYLENSDGTKSSVIMVTATENAKAKPDAVAEAKPNPVVEVKAKPIEAKPNPVVEVKEKPIEAKLNTAVEIKEKPVAQPVVEEKPNAVKVEAATPTVPPKNVVEEKKEVEKPIENKTVERNITSTINQKAEPAYQSGFYIQVSAVKTKRNLSEIKEYIHLLKDDNLIEVKMDKVFVYMVGPFSSRQDANEKIEYYKKYVPDAYVRKL